MIWHQWNRRKRGVTSLLFVAVSAWAVAQPTAGMVDDFQDGTTLSWGGGASPSNVPNAGPMGTGDNILQVIGAGGAGGGSVPATQNELQWTGDFTVNSIKVIRVQYKNYSTTSLGMRLVLFGLIGSRWTSVEAFPLGGNSGWLTTHHVLTSGTMVRVLGSESFGAVQGLVAKMMLRNNSGSATAGGTPAAATVGIDNITALSNVPLDATTMDVVSGLPFGGDVTNTKRSDDDYFYLLNDENEPNGELRFTSDEISNGIPTVSWSAIRFSVEVGATRDDLNTFVDMFDYTGNAWVTVASAASSFTDQTLTGIRNSNVTRYYVPTNLQVKGRVRWIPQSDLEAADGWSERVDQVAWYLEP